MEFSGKELPFKAKDPVEDAVKEAFKTPLQRFSGVIERIYQGFAVHVFFDNATREIRYPGCDPFPVEDLGDAERAFYVAEGFKQVLFSILSHGASEDRMETRIRECPEILGPLLLARLRTDIAFKNFVETEAS